MLKADIITSLVHDGERWVASNDKLTASGRTFSELDDDMRRALREQSQLKAGSTVMVYMGFDFSTIPDFLRQFAHHYFNRYVTIKI